MAGLREALTSLQKMRSLFQRRITAAARGRTAWPTPPAPSLREIATFGCNPGNLRMFAHVPQEIGRKPALSAALHGCTQSARTYALGTGWCDVADRHAFAVIYPEQQTSNNPKNCFSWFLPADTARGCGGALSIRQMIHKAVTDFDIDQSRIFVTGLSAGGAMATVMLAAYPEVFAGGAIIGGLPYGSAANVQEAFDAMFNDRAPSARALGDRVRAASQQEVPGRVFQCGTARPTPSSNLPMRSISSTNGSMCRACSVNRPNSSMVRVTCGASGVTGTVNHNWKHFLLLAWRMACRSLRQDRMLAGRWDRSLSMQVFRPRTASFASGNWSASSASSQRRRNPAAAP